MDRELAAKLAKLLRMLTSDHDGEVLSAVYKINGIAAAHDVDWDDALGGSTLDLTKAQMEQIYEAGRQKGLEEAAAAAQPGEEWAAVGEVGHDLAEVQAILAAAARAEADGRLAQFERSFASSMRGRIDEWGSRTFISEKQWKVLRRLRVKLAGESYL